MEQACLFERHTWAEIDLDALTHNFSLIRARAGEKAGGAGAKRGIRAGKRRSWRTLWAQKAPFFAPNGAGGGYAVAGVGNGRCARLRAAVRRGRVCAQRSELVAALVLPVHCQLAISGMSTPCAAMYCRCSTSLSRICCTA